MNGPLILDRYKMGRTSRYKIGDRVRVTYSELRNLKINTILTVDDNNDFYSFKESHYVTTDEYSLLKIEPAIPNNMLAKLMYPSYIESECGKYLQPI